MDTKTTADLRTPQGNWVMRLLESIWLLLI